MKNKVKIIMGSEKDFEFCKKIGETLEKFNIPYEYRVGSAHKTPEKVLEILDEDKKEIDIIYITVAGRSNALSGFIDNNTSRPVIACPPYSDKYAGADIFSSLRMPSGSAVLTVIEPEAAGIAAAKIFALINKKIEKTVNEFQHVIKQKLSKADEEVKKYGKC
ncbi:MAG: AIR carboxylase family protein [Candidatus Thermoplasmatota archaeon]|nr:AIR carboxylase family protein [Candidatus Thermoplasmatota archaeon]